MPTLPRLPSALRATLPLAAGLLLGVLAAESAWAAQQSGGLPRPNASRWPRAAPRSQPDFVDPRAWPALDFDARARSASSNLSPDAGAPIAGDPPALWNGRATVGGWDPRTGAAQRPHSSGSGYFRPWPQLPGSPPVIERTPAPELATPWPALTTPATPSSISSSLAQGAPARVESWDPGDGWAGTPPTEVRYGIRILPGYLDPTDPPPIGRPLRWRFVQAELSALFGDFTGFGLGASTPFDQHWYGRLGLRFGELYSDELDSDQCELALGYRWPQPVFDLWGEAYAELGMRVGEVENDNATGPRLEVGHRSRIAEPLELQVAVGLDASLPDELDAGELYLSSQLEWALGSQLALRFESELADVAVFRFVLRHYF